MVRETPQLQLYIIILYIVYIFILELFCDIGTCCLLSLLSWSICDHIISSENNKVF